MNRRVKQVVLPLTSALIWGVAFVFQDNASDYVSPFTFNFLRSVIAVIFLLGLSLATWYSRKKRGIVSNKVPTKKFLLAGILTGACIFLASYFQQLGITKGTSGGKAGFITAIYMVLVPLFSVFLGQKISVRAIISAVLSLFGIYLLCVTEGFSVRISDIYVLMCAVIFAIHIMVVDYYTNFIDGIKLTLMQFAFCAVFSGVCAIIFELGDTFVFSKFAGALIYVGLFSSGVGYLFQILAQKDGNPTVVSILLSTESFFAVVAQSLINKTNLTIKEYVGCAVILIAVLLTQVKFDRKNNDEKKLL